MNTNTNTMINAKDIAGYEGLYAITEDGQVWSYKKNKFLKVAIKNDGYLRVNLYKDGKPKIKGIHRLLMETYCPVVGMDKLQVNHIDEDKLNNDMSNLEWTTPRENTQHSSHKWKGKKRGSIKPVAQYSLDGELVAVYKNQTEAARLNGISRYSIVDVLRGRHNTGGGYIWRYYNDGQKTEENARS